MANTIPMTERQTKPQKMWAVLRDGEIYLIKPRRMHARHERDAYAINGHSQHLWTVAPVFVSRVARACGEAVAKTEE